MTLIVEPMTILVEVLKCLLGTHTDPKKVLFKMSKGQGTILVEVLECNLTPNQG